MIPARFFASSIFFSTVTLLAQPAFFAPPAPLTNTRYGAVTAGPIITANDALVFWSTPHNLRVGGAIARPLLESGGHADVVWVGTSFLAVASHAGVISGRILDSTGNAIGDPFAIVNGSNPRLATNGDGVTLLYDHGGVHALRLSATGVATGAPQLLGSAHAFDVAEDFVVLANGEDTIWARLSAWPAQIGLGHKAEHVAIASNGIDALVLWTNDEGTHAAEILGGIAQPPFAIGSESIESLSLAWNGSAYRAAFVEDGAARVIDLRPGSRDTTATPLPAMFGAAEQTLVAAASGANATLVVWNEGNETRAGVRLADGDWRELLLSANDRAIAAASDGREHVVVTENENGWAAVLLDDSGAIVRQSARIASFRARTVASNGSDYAVAGIDDAGNVVVARVLRDGSVSSPIVVRAAATNPALASDGTNYLLLWQTPSQTIEGVRLDGTLQRVDAADFVVFDTEAEEPTVAFNGTDYVVVWRGGPYVRGRRVRADGTVIPEFVQISASDAELPRDLHLTRLGDRIGLTWFDGRAQVAIFDRWTVQSAEGFESPKALLTSLPNGGVALFRSGVSMEVPHYGSNRVFASVAHAAPADAPLAPQIEVAQNGAGLGVSWAPRPGSGHRVEVSFDDGPWLEQEGWFRDGASIPTPRSGRYAVRVRTITDSGASAYSAIIETNVTLRRRSVR